MFNILGHNGNANPNEVETPSHPSQNSNHQENKQKQMLVGCEGERHLYAIDKNVN
jgi:hypothetical protein